MKNLFNNMDSSEIGRILEMHNKKGYSLSEQNAVLNDKLPPQFRDPEGEDRTGIPGLDDDSKQADYGINIPEVITIDGSLFKNGIANIDKNNTKYKDAVSTLKKLPANMSVKITGGASKVGSAEGYNNEKLAMLRATNFIKAAQSDGVKVQMTPSGKVGVSKEKNSPAAEAEQFVKVDFTKGGGFKGKTAIDKTRVDKKIPGGVEDIVRGGGGRLYKMCIGDLTATEYMELLKRFKNKIKSRGVQ
jgi:hypothetical protein